MPLLLKRKNHTARYFREKLSDSVHLDMMLIPGGSFLMGSPETEEERSNDESLHRVTIPTFCMGKYPITQAQWFSVVSISSLIHEELELEPSEFLGDDLPVEKISWFDAEEFCLRLSEITKRKYRLPSEAEWEYACRAGTSTPFYFGETITTDLANYDGTDDYENQQSGSYGDGPKGLYHRRTSNVNTFPPNSFGLYDMHGNILEWCKDHCYDQALTDTIDWIDPDETWDAKRILRGGSWRSYPNVCRSAHRHDCVNPDDHHSHVGLRVVCEANSIS
jgi:formylglycine-generating enzyme required for sulfatase activity